MYCRSIPGFCHVSIFVGILNSMLEFVISWKTQGLMLILLKVTQISSFSNIYVLPSGQ